MFLFDMAFVSGEKKGGGGLKLLRIYEKTTSLSFSVNYETQFVCWPSHLVSFSLNVNEPLW